MRVSAVWLGLGLLVGGPAAATEDANAAETAPDIELLEYLGELVLERGKWVGPEDMKGPPADAPIVHDDVRERDVDEDAE